MTRTDLIGAKVSVIGAERSGIAAAGLLRGAGAHVFVSDMGKGERTVRHVEELRRGGIDAEYGAHSDRVFDASLMVISPGVPTDAPVVTEALRRGIAVAAEIEAASWFCRGPIVAITGSNGKTTTTTLLGRMLADAKVDHVVAGNIGTAFSSVVSGAGPETTVVLEVSSFQLDFIRTFRPRVGVLLNITRNHLDRYGNSMERYAASKARLFMNQTQDDLLVVNAEDEWTQRVIGTARGALRRFSTRNPVEQGAFVKEGWLTVRDGGTVRRIVPTDEITITGEHNLQNAMAATVAALRVGVSPASVRATLRNFKGVEHRQEPVREVRGVLYINNSKATTVEAVEMALKSYDRPIVLIMGGKDKGNDYSTIDDLVRRKVKALVATGHSAQTIMKHFGGMVRTVAVETDGNAVPNVVSMRRTVETAAGLAERGDVVLLAPACTSFDWFTDYEERGRVFKDLVHKLPGQ